jgi:hypothetical protein
MLFLFMLLVEFEPLQCLYKGKKTEKISQICFLSHNKSKKNRLVGGWINGTVTLLSTTQNRRIGFSNANPL